MREIKALLRDPDTQVADMAQRYGVSRTTVYKYVEVIKPKDIFEAHH
ncbi:helix-turn-helix domain-containing protein [Asaia lannensis]